MHESGTYVWFTQGGAALLVPALRMTRTANERGGPAEAALLFFLARLGMTTAQTLVGRFIVRGRNSEHVHSALGASRSAWVFGHGAQIPVAFWLWYPYSHGKLAAMHYVRFPT
jgi:hypothetical protein